MTLMRVILDPKAGICGGVRRAIQLAERELAAPHRKTVYVLGDIIHNEREVERLDQAGLKTIHSHDLDMLKERHRRPECEAKVLIRAHGEPPETFQHLAEAGIEVVDGTCPVVTRSQDLARRSQQKGFQIAVVGKHHHPEMIGIVGHTGNRAVIVQYDEDIKRLEPRRPTLVMAQTTISAGWFGEMMEKIRAWVGEIEVADTLCRFVVRRDENLPQFARQADVILVVGGLKSSNTKMLHAACQAINPRSYHIVRVREIDPDWFKGAETIGVTGSASTPLWLLNEFVEALNRWIEKGCQSIEENTLTLTHSRPTSIKNPRPFMLIAHRGGLFYRPENTRAAFSHIIERGIEWIETDVRITREEILVLCHDDRVNMPSGRLEAVRDLTYRQLRGYDAGGGEAIMRLSDLFKDFQHQLYFDIEIKELDAVAKTIETIREYQLEDKVFLSAFMPEALQEARELAPDIARGLLVDRVVGRLVGGRGAVNTAVLLDCRYFLPHFHRVSESWVQAAHEAGILVIPWTVNHLEDVQRMRSLDVDGIISDKPDVFFSVF